jgi:putative membrane protein
VFFVGKEIKKWNFGVIFFLISWGTTIAILVSVLSPASENSSFFYLILCGIVAACSMILPGY